MVAWSSNFSISGQRGRGHNLRVGQNFTISDEGLKAPGYAALIK